MEWNKLKQKLKREVEMNIEFGHLPDEASWGHEIGILLSQDEVNAILERVKEVEGYQLKCNMTLSSKAVELDKYKSAVKESEDLLRLALNFTDPRSLVDKLAGLNERPESEKSSWERRTEKNLINLRELLKGIQ